MSSIFDLCCFATTFCTSGTRLGRLRAKLEHPILLWKRTFGLGMMAFDIVTDYQVTLHLIEKWKMRRKSATIYEKK